MRQEKELLQLVDSIFANRGLRIRIEGPDSFRDEGLYIEMCKILFPGLNIRLIKLSDADLPAGHKIQTLINYISDETGMELGHISGEAIARGKVVDTFNLLQFLQGISSNSPSPEGKLRSAPQSVNALQPEQHDFHTVLGINKEFHNDPVDFDEDHQNQEHKKQSQNQQPDLPDSINGPFEQEILQEIRKAKQKLHKTAEIDNRKDQNLDLKKVKNRYKAYLKDLIIDKKVGQNIEEYRKPKEKNKSVPYYAMKQAEEVDTMQKAMGLKLRDNKDKYMRKIKQIVFGLERKKIHEQTRQQRQIQKDVQAGTRNKMESLTNQHQRHRGLLKQSLQQVRANCVQFQRENRKIFTDSQRRIKQHYHHEREKLKSRLQQQNDKVLQIFEDGELEQIIIDMYKKI